KLMQNTRVNLVDLYEKFIRKKYDIYLKEHENISPNKVGVKQRLEREYKAFKKVHQKLAMFLLFDKNDIKTLLGLSNEQKCKHLLEKVRGRVERNGIIELITPDDIPIFVHKTFAEYLV